MTLPSWQHTCALHFRAPDLYRTRCACCFFKANLHNYAQVQGLLQDMQTKFQAAASEIVERVDGLGARIDLLEGQIQQLVKSAEGDFAQKDKRKAN